MQKPLHFVAAFEIGRRIASGTRPDKLKVHSPESVAKHYMPRLETAKQEEFYVILLDTANSILSEHVISRGSLNASVVHPREVFKKAIIDSAAQVILMHNHPSGNPEPSSEDKDVTANLVNAGAVIGINVIDHIIIAGQRYFSFADHELL